METQKPTTARCKFECSKVEETGGGSATISLQARYDAEQSKEDAAFSHATPWGNMTFGLSNPNLDGFFEVGKVYYIDVTPVG